MIAFIDAPKRKGQRATGEIHRELFAPIFASLILASCLDAHPNFVNRSLNQVDGLGAMSAFIWIRFVEIGLCALQSIECCLHVRLIRSGRVIMPARVLNARIHLGNRLTYQVDRLASMPGLVARRQLQLCSSSLQIRARSFHERLVRWCGLRNGNETKNNYEDSPNSFQHDSNVPFCCSISDSKAAPKLLQAKSR